MLTYKAIAMVMTYPLSFAMLLVISIKLQNYFFFLIYLNKIRLFVLSFVLVMPMFNIAMDQMLNGGKLSN